MTLNKTAALAGICALAFASSASATTFTYDLNIIVGGTLSLSPNNYLYGKVTVSDDLSDSKAVDFTIDLGAAGAGSGEKIQEFDFNVSSLGIVQNTTDFYAYSTTLNRYLSVGYSPNGEQADGYTTGKFDLVTPEDGSFGNVIEPLKFVLTAYNRSNKIDLNASFFN